jgi:hypothetical protein
VEGEITEKALILFRSWDRRCGRIEEYRMMIYLLYTPKLHPPLVHVMDGGMEFRTTETQRRRAPIERREIKYELAISELE